jgi:single-strand DNA-binding protein
MSNINRVVMTGNLCRDPELRSTGGGTSVCSMRIAVNGRKKNAAGEWVDDPNFFDVTVWGAHGENCARYLARGRPVGIDGRLDWQEWEDRETGQKRQRVQIVADNVQFLGGRDDGGGSGSAPAPSADIPIDASDFRSAPTQQTFGGPPAPGSGGAHYDDDIPFRARFGTHDDRCHRHNPFGGAA